MSSQKRSKRGVRNTRNRRTQKPTNRQLGMTMYSSPRDVMPPEFDTTLKYIVLAQVTNAGATAASIRYSTNAYDVDPSLGSTAMAGFTEFAAFYKRFRTIGMKYKFSCANFEAFPVTIIHGFSTTSIASGALGIGYATNPLWRTGVLGQNNGQCRGTYTQSASVCKIYGTQQPLMDDLFTGSTTSSTLPTAATAWCYFGILSPAILTIAGAVVTAEITLKVRFYSANLLLV